MDDELDILFDEKTIRNKVRELAGQISRDYAGKELIAVCVLKGAAIFTADLVRSIAVPVVIEFAGVSSYGSGTVSSGAVRLGADIAQDIQGRNVLLVDGIVDSGRTLAALVERYAERGPASLRSAVLLDKPGRRTTAVQIDYRGFTVPDRFLVGYGLDLGQRYRNLPYIAAIRT